jgi:hypothetical protein
MKRSIPACLIATSLMLACPGSGEDDSGDATSVPMTGSSISLTNQTTGDEQGETTAPEPTGGATSDTGDTGADSSTGFNCGVEDIVASVTIPRVMLVLDKSGSMVADEKGYWDADGDDADDDGFKDADPAVMATPRITRWQSLHETVNFIVTDFEERMDFGAVLFPSVAAKGTYSTAACPVKATPDVEIGENQGAAILMTIPPASEVAKIAGGTPATAGMLTGLAGLSTDDPTEDLRPKYVILVTDGAANCPIDPIDDEPESLFEVYDDQLPVVVGQANADKIPTFVVGIDIKDVTSDAAQEGNPNNTNTYEKLNEVAVAGGQAREGDEKFYNTANQLELQAALMSISELITSCEFPLSMPVNENLQRLEELIVDQMGGNPLIYDNEQVADCATESGWHYTDATKSAIELCGDACTLFKQTGDVDIVFGCVGL